MSLLDDDFDKKVEDFLNQSPSRPAMEWDKVISTLRDEARRDISRAEDAMTIDRDPGAALVFRFAALMSNRLAAAYEAGLPGKVKVGSMGDPADVQVVSRETERKPPKRSRGI